MIMNKNATPWYEVVEGGREREGERMYMERRLCQKGRAEKVIMQTTLQPNRSSKSVLLVWRTLQDGVGMRMRRQDVSASRSQRVFCQQRHVRKQIGRRLTHYKRG